MSQVHRISLTPFERYQFWETQTGHPNQITAVFDFEGQVRPDALAAALQKVCRRHPLFSAAMEIRQGTPVFWQLNPKSEIPLTILPSHDTVDFDRIPDLPAIHPADEPAGRLTVRYDSVNRCQWILQTHHAHCDGVGGLQLIRELLQYYHAICNGTEIELRELPIEKLQRRNQWQANWQQLWKKPLQVLGLFGASKFLLRKPVDLSLAKPRADQQSFINKLPAVACTEGHAESTRSRTQTGDSLQQQTVSFAFVDHQLTASQTKRMRQWAKQSDVTVNSLLLSYWMISLQQWTNRNPQEVQSQWFRLVIPTNERTAADINLSACNRVSLVYVDRRAAELDYPEALMKGIHFEMSVMRNLNLTRTLLLALRIMNWFPGMLKRHAQTPKCWATSYVTNLGGVLDRLNIPRTTDGESQVGELTMKRVRLLPPLRPGTPIALAVNQYAQRLSFTVHFDSNYIARDDAQQILQYFLNRILTLS